MPASPPRALRRGRPARALLLAGGAAAVYAAAFGPLVAALGPAVGAFGVLPVVLAAWHGGRRWGLAFGGLVGGPLHLALYVAAMPELGLVQHALGAAPSAAVFALVGYGLGRFRELALAVRASEARYRDVVETVRDAVLQTDVDGRWTYLNPAWERITGFAVEESLGRPLLDFVHPEERGRHDELFGPLERGEVPFVRFETRYLTRDGGTRHVEVHAQLQRGRGGAVVGTTGTATDVTDSVRYAAEHEARERTEEMLRLKDSFLSNMSHELRTPLTGILGFADVLAEEAPPHLHEPVAIIRQSAQRLQETVNSVLDLAQLEGEGVRLCPEPVDVAAEAREVAAALGAVAAGRGLSLGVVGAGCRAVVDRSALHRVLNNLVGNALKFTDRGGVTVRVEPAGGAVRVAVADTGRGIDPAFLPRLYDEFRQASEGLDREHEGNGLGMTITKRLVELMGGTIGVETALGVGTTFTVSLPLRPPPRPAAAARRRGEAAPPEAHTKTPGLNGQARRR